MPSAVLSAAIDADTLAVDAVDVGCVPPGLGTPDRFACLRDASDLLLRVDVYIQLGEAHCFEVAEAWMDFIVIGIGERVYLVHAKTREVTEHRLGSYFGHVYRSESVLYVTSAERVFSIKRDGHLLWESNRLGLDGVLIHEINEDSVRGEGEWDPPGGWRHFAISASTGELLAR